MSILQGNFREEPQETHWWNNLTLTNEQAWVLNPRRMLAFPADDAACKPWVGAIPRFHMPLFGGWSKYVVLRPQLLLGKIWYIGWKPKNKAAGLSLIPLNGYVRMLRGDQEVQFFGLDEHGQQITICFVVAGEIGKATAEQARIPLR